MKGLKVGDRVAAYGWVKTKAGAYDDRAFRYREKPLRGEIIRIIGGGAEIVVKFDDGTSSEVHAKQCQRLKKKICRVCGK